MKASKVQTLRGLACCLLLLYHVIGATASQGLRVQDGWLRQFTEALVVVRMPVFGLIAGAMHGLSSKRAWALVQHKAARLLLPEHGRPGHDYVFIARQGATERPWTRLLDDVKSALIRLAAEDGAPGPGYKSAAGRSAPSSPTLSSPSSD